MEDSPTQRQQEHQQQEDPTGAEASPSSNGAPPAAAGGAGLLVQHASYYGASPTASDEGGGGASPVKARMATRFFTPPSAARPVEPPAGLATPTTPAAGAAGASSVVGAQQQQLGRQHSIYNSRASSGGSFDQLSGKQGSSVRRIASAPLGPGHHLQHHGGMAAGSHTSLVEVEHLAGTEVSVELYVPKGGEHVKDTFWPCTFNLSKVIMGAGMMAIPKAFMLLGLIPGTILMLLIASLTFFTLAGLIAATAATGTGGSYGALVRRTIGPKAQAALEFAVLANCYIMLVVFVVVLGDILIGSAPTYGGLLPEWTGINPESCFWMRRDVVLGAVSLAVLLPLAAMRSMERLAAVNIIGVASNGVFAGLMLALAAGAASNGVLQPPPLLPDWSELGNTPMLAAVAIATVVPVLLNCDVCHQSLHPLMPLLQPYTVSRMQRLVAVALATCNTVYLTIILCGGLVFGSALEADVLSNVNSAAMAPLIGPNAAVLMAAVVRIGYLLSCIGSYVLLCYPLRQCLGDQLLGGQANVQKHWLLITALLVVSASAIGCYLPSIWGALSLVGATTSTVQAFIIPGLVILSVERAAAQAAAAASRASAFASQQRTEHGLSTPLLAAVGDDAEVGELYGGAGSTGGRGGGAGRYGAGAPPAALEEVAGSFKVDRPPQPAWLCFWRQVVAAFAVFVGVALFANSVVEALWRYAHPHAEGMALTALYRMLATTP